MPLLLINKKSFFLLIILFQTGCFLKENNVSKKLISVPDLIEDFAILRKTLEEAHPGLYWYADKTSMDRYFDSTKATIKNDMTGIDFFKLLLPVIANIRCGHTNLQLAAETNAGANKFSYLLPFDFYCQNGKVYISKALKNDGHEGAEVASVNNIDTRKILRTILMSLPGDGYNETYKYELVSKGAFREGFALFFGQPEKFALQVIDSHHRLSSFSVKAILPADIILSSKKSSPAFALAFRQNTAILSINTFEMNKARFADSLSAFFHAIQQKESKYLILDLRRNGGGINNNVSQLYAYIATAPFLHLKRAEMKVSALSYPHFISNAESIPLSSQLSDTPQVKLVNDRYEGTKEHNPSFENLFAGKVLILTNGNTSSAASEFAALAHFTKRAKIVGEETGGCYYGSTGGNYLALQLPHSGLKVRIPTIKILTAVDEDFNHQPRGHGTLPDYKITPAIGDVIKNRDIQLETAMKILAD